MARPKIYYGSDQESGRTMYATVTGIMSDGSLVYTEIESQKNGAIVIENGEPKLLLDRQYIRHVKYGTQTFERI